MQKYWCVINWRNPHLALEVSNMPTKGHSTRAAALIEAERLAELHAGEYFTVFEAVARVSTNIKPIPRAGTEYAS